MHNRAVWRTVVCLAILFCRPNASAAQESLGWAAFVSPQCIITSEASGARRFIVNIINLSDYVIVVPASNFIYKTSSGNAYIGQVYDQQSKTTRGEVYRYSATILIKNGTFKGLNILGAFREQDQMAELSVRIGSRRYYLKGMDRNQFGKLQEKIEDLDLENADRELALKSAGLDSMGEEKTADVGSDWESDWQNLIHPDGLNPPKYIESPGVTPTEDAVKNKIRGAVKLSGLLTRDGILENITVVNGLGHGLDERAIDVVKRTWVFLPATLNGEVVESKIQFEVPIAPANQ
jgi:hypothetical protein